MARHALMLGAVFVGLIILRAPLSKQPKRIDVSADMQQLLDQALPVSERVDAEFQRVWAEKNLTPAEPADQLLVARRLSLGLTGTVPSLEEIRTLESLDESLQLTWWLQHLFEDRRYGDYLAERLARAVVGTENGPFLIYRRRRFVSWLSDRVMENRPYDEIVRALICDHGNWTGNPAVNFVTVTTGSKEKDQPDPERLAARTTRAFLGVRLDCVQCHDDHLGGDWRQSDFQQLAAFYSEVRSFSLGLGIRDVPRVYEFQYLGADQETVVEPTVPFAADLYLPSEKPRRQQLADWVTHPQNKAFARTAVNRAWAFLFGRPLVPTVDDIPLEGPYPPGLETLAEDFAQHRDLRQLITQIAMTQVFRQQSRLPGGVTETDEANWAVFPLVRLRPEQVAGSVVQACSLSTLDSSSHIVQRFARFTQVSEFVKRYGDQGEDEFGGRGGTIPQRLVMLNGKLVHERTKDDLVANAATRIAKQVDSDERAIVAAFLAVLTRRPTEIEEHHFGELLHNTERSRAHQFEDMFWALMNSTEFSWNH